MLVYTPEDFSRDRQTLIGPQAMRKRILAAQGFKIMELQLDTLEKLSPKQVKKHLAETYYNVALSD